MTNNLLVNLQIDRVSLLDSKNASSATGKLLALLEASPNGQVSLAAVLQSVESGKGKFFINGVGQLDVPLNQSDLPELQTKATIQFTLGEGKVIADVQFEEVFTPEKANEKAVVLEKNTALLKQMGMPANELNLKALSLLNEYHVEPSAERIKQLAEGSFLASKTNVMASDADTVEKLVVKDEQIDWSKSLKRMVLDWMTETDVKQKTATVPVTGKELFKSAAVPVEGMAAEVQDDQETLAGKGEKVSQPAQRGEVEMIKQLFEKLTPKTLLPLVTANLPLDLENISRSSQVFSGDKTIGHIKRQFIEQLTMIFKEIQPSEALKADVALWLEADANEFALSKQMTLLEQVIAKHNPEAAEQLKESFEQLSKASGMVEQVSQQMYAMHLPIRMGDHETQIEMYVNKRRQKGAQEDFRMLLALNTNTLGQVQVLLADQKQLVEVQFRLEDEATKALFESEEAAFETQIESFQEKRVKVSFGCHFKEPAVLEAMKFIGSDQTSGIDVRV